ncbi:deoxynucleotidyltransferase terminal-interacting protein 2 isoform X2 [Homalodisca vitripennis]|uniref:deoxynucleotidyltransferase terminal-interacting protein 2 isoform X2 n=1 Tax=Homalodisca vitripennis TaxID=197043 RepID=UPI001EEAF5AB|nr:deoxynucleotidyltransferase terminal-interacting protein 2 isoform X2 [Homalodisca vitripennis]
MEDEKYDFSDIFLDLDSSNKTNDVSELLKNSVIKPGFEQHQHIANFNKSTRKLKIERKMEREKTRGPQWFNLPATSVTPEVENDLKIIQMRSVLDSKHFYKKNDLKVLPKYFESASCQAARGCMIRSALALPPPTAVSLPGLLLQPLN